ncbi:MAG: SGNH/GDSL hydrolase family protein [Kiritimatiellia bacterium]
MKRLATRIKSLIIPVGLAFLAAFIGIGCEDGGGGSRHNHDAIDFGNNNRDIYVAFGDSITGDYNFGVTPYPPRLASMLGKTVINEGRGGETSSGGAGRVRSVLSRHKPGYLLILYGINDLLHGNSADGIIDNLRHIIRTAKGNKTVPVIATLTPVTGRYHLWSSGVDSLNDRIRDLARQEDAWLVDLANEFNYNERYMSIDGLHPNEDGCQLMAMAFYDEVN